MTAPAASTAIPSTGVAASPMPTGSPMTATMPQPQSGVLTQTMGMSPSVCVNCGTPLGAGVRFCPSCGNKVDATA
ncbi:MAG TPA: zinc-ribbon domain-containing protein [Thermomicrobiaceae bacterium]|nr:zinc-ribbon domain-containing protein [Thermomicrobiaceae bacterium]